MASALFLFTTKLNSHFTLPKLAVTACLTVALLGTFLVRVKRGDYQVLPKAIRFPLLLLVIWWLLGTSQAIHLQTALEGQYGRYNGLYTNLLLMIIFVTVSSIPYDAARFRRFISTLLLMVLMVCLYGFMQYMGFDAVFDSRAGYRPPSSIGNPVALAAILLLAIPFSLSEIWLCDQLKKKITATVFFITFFLILLVSGSRGPIIAGLLAILIMFVYGIVSHYKHLSLFNTKRTIVLVVTGFGVLTGAISLLYFTDRLVLGSGFEMRILYFKVALEAIVDSPIFGFGFESFRLIYPLYRPPMDFIIAADRGTIITPTMIHNDYLQLSVDNGIPSMLFYLFMISGVLWLIFKSAKVDKQYRTIHIAILAMLIGYLMQSLSGWSEAASSIMFWLVLAVSSSFMLQGAGVVSTVSRSSNYMYTIIMTGGLFVTMSYAVLLTIKVTQDYTLRKAQSYSNVGYKKPDEYLKWLGKTSSNDSYYQDQIGLIYMRRLMKRPTRQTYQLTRQYFLRARELNKFDPYARFHLIETDVLALRSRIIDKPSAEANEDMVEILRMDFNNPTVYQVRAAMYAVTGNLQAAKKNLTRMKQIKSLKK